MFHHFALSSVLLYSVKLSAESIIFDFKYRLVVLTFEWLFQYCQFVVIKSFSAFILSKKVYLNKKRLVRTLIAIREESLERRKAIVNELNLRAVRAQRDAVY